MAVRDILVHLDAPQTMGSLVPATVQLARDPGAPGLTPAALAEVPIRISAAPLPFGLLKAHEPPLLAALGGRAAAIRAIAGITVGFSAWLLATLFGLSRTPLFSEPGLEVLRWLGAAWMLRLAWDAVKPVSAAASRPDHDRPLVRGLAANLLNPGAAIFYLALRLLLATGLLATTLWLLSIPLSPGPAA